MIFILKIVRVIIIMTQLNLKILILLVFKQMKYHMAFRIRLIGAKPVRIRLDKVNAFIRIYDGARYLVLILKNMVSLTTESDIL